MKHAHILARLLLIGLLALAGCSIPQLAYNNADTLVRFKLYDYIDPSDEQNLSMSAAIHRLHVWHRRNELPRYADAFDEMARRVETGLNESDVTWLRDLVRARYRALAARAVEEGLPTARTLEAENFAALKRKFAERNDDYADEYLSGSAKDRHEAMYDHLEEHLERWIGTLSPDQRAVVMQFVESQSQFPALRLENRKHLQQLFLDALQRLTQGQPGAEDALRDLMVNWEDRATPQYRQALRDWERGMVRMIVEVDRRLSPTQRADAVTRLREYGAELHALVDPGATRAAAMRRASTR